MRSSIIARVSDFRQFNPRTCGWKEIFLSEVSAIAIEGNNVKITAKIDEIRIANPQLMNY
jgi:hypothetical protein